MADVYLGIGSNMGDRQANIHRAIQYLQEHEDIQVVAVSSMIETDPEEACLPDRQGLPQEKFLNGALHIKTDLLPLDLLSQLKMIERRLGRQKSAPNSPRPMDLDILFYDDVVIRGGKTLSIPHPRLDKRAFVLRPLLEIAPALSHPRSQKTVRELLDSLTDEPRPSTRSLA